MFTFITLSSLSSKLTPQREEKQEQLNLKQYRYTSCLLEYPQWHSRYIKWHASYLNSYVLVPGLSAWINTSVHGVSFFLMIFNVILGREKVLIRMVLPVLATVVLYMLFTFVIHAT